MGLTQYSHYNLNMSVTSLTNHNRIDSKALIPFIGMLESVEL